MEHLLGEEVKAEYLNDDRLGRVLDKVYKIGLNKIFVFILLEVIKKYQLNLETVHLDSSSFHVDGEYKNLGENTAMINRGINLILAPCQEKCFFKVFCSRLVSQIFRFH